MFWPHWVCTCTGVSVLSPSTLLRLPAALYGAGPALSAAPVFGYSTKARIRLRLRVVSSPPQRFMQPEACPHSSRVRAPFPSAASGPGSQRLRRTLPGCGARCWSGLRKSLDRNRGAVCRVGGGGLSGAEFAPCPSPCLLPPVGMGRLFSGVSQSPRFVNRRRCVLAG